ncbi:hypothetical protein JYU34_005970 [Plutella xylostella]|uniref:Cytochrome P450 n=1 Tax=Plutella xylostella TaxID=51655 RepID=A0ABQ7QUM4_PLUXY|nr:hypothetical protein JYU34_005970 [Plutella xylostella]
MTRSNNLFRQYQLITRPSRRQISSSSSDRTSTSPQRRGPAVDRRLAEPRRFSDIPGPMALPMMRHSAHILPRIGSFHHVVGLGLLDSLRTRYGDLVRLAKGSRTRPVLYVFDPEMMRESCHPMNLPTLSLIHLVASPTMNLPRCLQVYDSSATAPPHWEGSPLSQQRKTNPNRCPIQGDESKAIWAALRALLLDGSLLKNYEKAFDDIATDATRRLEELRHAENALNEEIETELYRWALESLGVLVFGTRLGCLDGPAHVPTDENRTPEQTSLDDDAPAQCSLTKRSLSGLTAAERLVRASRDVASGGCLVRSELTLRPDTDTFNEALKAFDTHFSLMEHFLKQGLEGIDSGELAPEKSLLDKLRPLKNRLLPVTADMMLAGVDPLAQSALGMLYHLSLHAAQQQRAHDEVSWAAASRSAGAGCPELPYLAGVAREALRLHPATGGVVRRSREEFVVADYVVPAGVDIVLAHGVTSKCDKEWGRPKAFIPERWCSDWQPLSASRAHPLASMPFGESCPAEGVVGKMLASLATRILDKYRLEWHGPPPNLVTAGVNKIQQPFYFVLKNAA